MTETPADPLAEIGLTGFAARLRDGGLTSEGVTQAYLSRIAALDGRVGAYEIVDAERALAAARAIDALRASGTDLGPLMGVPVAVKDILAVRGLPATGGSRLDLAEFIGEEGRFVARLRAAGCVILGKTRTVEFAFGAVGINAARGTPWNPADAGTHRIPGGSSSGSAAAVAAGLCGLAIGSDTGGSVRVPAALCGIAGLKTSDGRWPRDGVLPLSPTFDTIGLLARSVEDLDLAFGALDEEKSGAGVADLSAMSFGVPRPYFYEGLEPGVSAGVEGALETLRQAGARLIEIAVPEARERETIFPAVLGPELLAGLGRDRFEAGRADIDPLVAARITAGLGVSADTYIRALARRQALVRLARERMRGLDGWLTPATAVQAAPVAEFDDPKRAMELTMGITRNSQPGNMFAQCGLSIPIPGEPGALPVGLQLMLDTGEDARLLRVGRAVEAALGRPRPAETAGFA